VVIGARRRGRIPYYRTGVMSFGEKGRQREPKLPTPATGSHEVEVHMPAEYGLLGGLSGAERMSGQMVLAEGVGFEPTLRFPVNTLSKRAP
jgi:hypothetical protein